MVDQAPPKVSLKDSPHPDLVRQLVEAISQDIRNFLCPEITPPKGLSDFEEKFGELAVDEMAKAASKSSALSALLVVHPHYLPPANVILEPSDLERPENHHSFSKEWIADAVQLAKIDPDIFDFVVEIGQDHLLTGGPLPKELREFLAFVIGGQTKRPTSKGQSPTSNQNRDFVILFVFEIIFSLFDVNFDKNSTSNSVCAIDLIADGFAKAGFPEVTRSAVRQVWENRETSGRLKQWHEYQALCTELLELKAVPK